MSEIPYVGNELSVFALAREWKSYVKSHLRPYLRGTVLEVGAGIGSATQALYDGTQARWVCLEPDRSLAQQIPLDSLPYPEKCEIRISTLHELPDSELFDCIVYMDVLEHIERDAEELESASRHLEIGGCIVILSPALPFLYTEFDAAIGHYRRYTKDSLRAVAPRGLVEATCIYLDSVGALASLGNRLMLRSAIPTRNQILFWDRIMVPASRFADKVVNHSVGRSILAVWKKQGVRENLVK